MNKKVIKQLEKIEQDHFDGMTHDDLGEACAAILEGLPELQHYSTIHKLSWHGLSAVKVKYSEIIESLKTITADEECAQRYSSIIEQIEDETKSLYETIKQNNFANGSIDFAIISSVLQEMKDIQTREEKDFGYLSSVTPYFKGDEILLVKRMQAVDKIFDKITDLPLEKKDISSLRTQAKSIKDSVSENVIEHCDSLKKIEEKQTHDTPLIDVIEESLENSKKETMGRNL